MRRKCPRILKKGFKISLLLIIVSMLTGIVYLCLDHTSPTNIACFITPTHLAAVDKNGNLYISANHEVYFYNNEYKFVRKYSFENNNSVIKSLDFYSKDKHFYVNNKCYEMKVYLDFVIVKADDTVIYHAAIPDYIFGKLTFLCFVSGFLTFWVCGVCYAIINAEQRDREHKEFINALFNRDIYKID